jgi:putative two-component system response regulator
MDRRTLLVVDDTPENIDLLVELLKNQYKVKAARNGQAALRIARSDDPPELVLLDLIMPGMDGFAVCHELKKSAATAAIPVILLSGAIGKTERRRGDELGCAGYLTKPVEPSELFAMIKRVLTI